MYDDKDKSDKEIDLQKYSKLNRWFQALFFV